jgi:hypothetical protein
MIRQPAHVEARRPPLRGICLVVKGNLPAPRSLRSQVLFARTRTRAATPGEGSARRAFGSKQGRSNVVTEA